MCTRRGVRGALDDTQGAQYHLFLGFAFDVQHPVLTQVAERKGKEASLRMFVGLLLDRLLLEITRQALGEARLRREALRRLENPGRFSEGFLLIQFAV